MALRKGAIPIQFGQGVDNLSDPKTVVPTKLLDLQNCTFDKAGSLIKRNGYAVLPVTTDTGATVTGMVGLSSRADELLVFADGPLGRCYSYRASTDEWNNAGDVASVYATTEAVCRNGTNQGVPDVASTLGVMVVAWENVSASSATVWCSVLEEGSGRVLLPPTQLDTDSVAVRCLQTDMTLQVVWSKPALGELWTVAIDPAGPITAPTPILVTNDLSTVHPRYDAESVGPGVLSGGQQPAVIAWISAAGGFKVAYLEDDGSLSSLSSHAITIEDAIAVTIDRSLGATVAVVGGGIAPNPHIVVAFIDSAGLAVVQRTFAHVGGLGIGVYKIACCFGQWVAGSPLLHWIFEMRTVPGSTVNQTSNRDLYAGRAIVNSTAYDSARSNLRGHVLASRAFYDGPTLSPSLTDPPDGQVYVTVAHGAQLFPYAATLRLSTDDGAIASPSSLAVTRLMPGELFAPCFRNSNDPDLVEVFHLGSAPYINRETSGDKTSRQHIHALPFRIQLDSEDGDQFSEVGIKLVRLNFAHPSSYSTAELGRGLYLAGALPQHYDSSKWAEADFHTAPDWGYNEDGSVVDPVTQSFTITGGGNMAAGTYAYVMWYEAIDALGELHVGPVSRPVEVTVAASGKVFIQIPSYRLTAREVGTVRLCVGRSLVGGSTDEMFRVTSTDPSQGGDNGYLINEPEFSYSTFSDVLSDADLRQREPVYTNGGILSNDPAAWRGDVIASGKNRLFWTDATDPNLVRYSKDLRDETAAEMPAEFTLRVPPYGGDIRAISVLDDKVIVFKETAVYAFAGPGPDADGGAGIANSNAFTPADLVTSDVGCDSPRSVGLTPLGLIFQSTKGIRMLNRAAQIQPIGLPVDSYRGQFITACTLLPDREHIIMLTDDGRSLLYDYLRDQWSTYTNHLGIDATVVDGRFYYLRTDSTVFGETPGIYRDDDEHIVMRIDTAWIKMNAYLQGWQRIHHALFVGTYRSQHQLRVQYRIDYRDDWTIFPDIDCTSDVGPGYGTVYQQRVHINRRCQAIAFRLEDVETSLQFGASFELTEMLLTGGILGPAFVPGAGRSQ